MGDASKPKDKWDKVSILGQLLSALILPIALLVAGHLLGEMAGYREQLHRQVDRQRDEARLRLDRANGLLESLASDDDRKRRVAVEWAKYLDRIKELPPEAMAVIVDLALTDKNTAVAEAAGTVAAAAAVGDVMVRELAAARLVADPSLRERSSQLTLAVEQEVDRAEGHITLPPCRASGLLLFTSGDCDRNSASVAKVCSGRFPRTATVRATRVFTKWADDPRPWPQAEAAVGRDGEWNAFESVSEENVGDGEKQV